MDAAFFGSGPKHGSISFEVTGDPAYAGRCRLVVREPASGLGNSRLIEDATYLPFHLRDAGIRSPGQIANGT